MLSLLTFNTLGTPFIAPDITKRYNIIANQLNKSDYDVVCLQEVLTYYHLFLFKRKLKNFPYLCYQKNPLGPRGGLVIFSKIPFSDKSYFAYSYPKKGFIPWYAYLAQHGILSCSLPSFSLRLSTTHLSSDFVHDLTPKDKFYLYIKSQAEEAAVEFNKMVNKFQSVILAGDFNIAKGSELYQSFVRTTKATDIFKDDNDPTYYNDRIPFVFTAVSPNRIDTVFVRSNKQAITTKKTEHIFNEPKTLSNGKKSYLSDHIALHCILSVNE